MALGDIYEATAGETTDLYYVDVGMYDTPEAGLAYILDAERPALVDTGTGLRYETVLDAMTEVGIAPDDLAAIVPTHVHLDHAGGAGYLAEACPNADVYVHEIGASHLADPEQLWQGTKHTVGEMIEAYAEPKPVPEDRVVELTDGDSLDLGDRALDVHHAPGHAAHQAVFYDPANDGAFTADAAGNYAPGLDSPYPETAPPGFDLEQCLDDIETLQDIDPSALYYGHFGDRPADGHLAEYAAVLEQWVADVEAARERLDDDEAVVDHFVERAETDEWRDSFDAWGERKARWKMALNVRGILAYLDDRDE